MLVPKSAQQRTVFQPGPSAAATYTGNRTIERCAATISSEIESDRFAKLSGQAASLVVIMVPMSGVLDRHKVDDAGGTGDQIEGVERRRGRQIRQPEDAAPPYWPEGASMHRRSEADTDRRRVERTGHVDGREACRCHELRQTQSLEHDRMPWRVETAPPGSKHLAFK